MSEQPPENPSPSSIAAFLKTVNAVTHTLLAAAIIWVCTNINNANVALAKFSADFAAVQSRQDELVSTMSRLHDSVLVMSSTYATKEDVTESIGRIEKDITDMKRSITVLEAKVQTISVKDNEKKGNR